MEPNSTIKKRDWRSSTQEMKLPRFSRFRGTRLTIWIERCIGEVIPLSSNTVPNSRVEPLKQKKLLNSFVDRYPLGARHWSRISSVSDCLEKEIFVTQNKEVVAFLESKYPDSIVKTVERGELDTLVRSKTLTPEFSRTPRSGADDINRSSLVASGCQCEAVMYGNVFYIEPKDNGLA